MHTADNLFGFDIEIPEEEKAFFLEQLKVEHFKKHDYFHNADTVCKKIGFIRSGLMKSFIVDEKVNEKIVEFYAEGSFVSAYTSFISGTITDWNIQAMEDTEVWSISNTLLQSLYKRHHCWTLLGLKIFEMQTLKKCNREKSLLANSATDRYRIFLNEYTAIEPRLPLNQIASYIGIQPESLSRIRKNLQT